MTTYEQQEAPAWRLNFAARLKRDGGGTSTYATRALLMEEPPSIDAGEITDKGYINQRAVLERRAQLAQRLFGEPLHPEVVLLG